MRVIQRLTRYTILIWAVVFLAGCEPKDRRPGTWLSGEIVEKYPADWSFIADHQEIFVETDPWYGIPFSVTTVIGLRDGKLYVPSIYDEELPFPGTKYWNSIIADNPDVRLKIGSDIYEMRATLVQNAAEYRQGTLALAEKYDSWQRWLDDPDSGPHYVIIRMDPRI